MLQKIERTGLWFDLAQKNLTLENIFTFQFEGYYYVWVLYGNE